ncbi:MAG TPA: HNH endonuclease [Myxococcaceae bacterium]|nr:HNH endonuclease [Myxococcaceae bacterium]
MLGWPKTMAVWVVTFLCACSTAIPGLPVQQRRVSAPSVLVIRPGGYKPVDLSREELQQGMRMLYANGPLPGLPKNGRPRFILAGDDPMQRLKAEGYLRWCHHITGKRFDCWDDLNASGELDDEGATFVALHFAFAEALEDAASAVRSMTADQVRAMLSVLFLGMIVELLSPEPVTKILFMVSMSNLIAFVGVDVFNNVVKGFISMLDELKLARDFAGVRVAGIHYGQRMGPTVGRIVVMVATYGVAKFAGLFKGSALDLPGGSRAAALAEAQGFRIPEIEGTRSLTLAANGSVVIDLGGAVAMSAGPKAGASGGPGAGKRFSPQTKDAAESHADGKCVFCGKETTDEPGPSQRNTDHAQPKSRGGNNTIDNAQNTCRTCNLEKGAKTTEEHLQGAK